MIEKLILFACIAICAYLLVDICVSQNLNRKISKYLKFQNEKYLKKAITCYEKNKKIKLKNKINFFHKLYILIEKASIKNTFLINPVTLILMGIILFFICNTIVFSIFKQSLLSIIISFPALFIPIVILSFIVEEKNKKIEKVILNVLLQLKNYTQINNDIIYALKQVKTVEPLQTYIKKFLLEINSGIRFENAMENLKEKINFEKLKVVFNNMQYCYLYGGSFSELMTKSYKMIDKIQKEKNRREQETKSARMVLFILILLDVFVYFTFIKDDYENYKIMTKTIIGNLILYWNFISIWILFWLMSKVKKLDY